VRYNVNWKDITQVTALADTFGYNTLVVKWPGREHFNITTFVNNFEHVVRSGGRISYVTEENPRWQ
jgi:hypothetical protein